MNDLTAPGLRHAKIAIFVAVLFLLSSIAVVVLVHVYRKTSFVKNKRVIELLTFGLLLLCFLLVCVLFVEVQRGALVYSIGTPFIIVLLLISLLATASAVVRGRFAFDSQCKNAMGYLYWLLVMAAVTCVSIAALAIMRRSCFEYPLATIFLDFVEPTKRFIPEKQLEGDGLLATMLKTDGVRQDTTKMSELEKKLEDIFLK
jgi:hypothetical protein